MATNPYVNKVQKADGTTLIDLTSDTAVASDVAQGKYFHLATGERVQGTASGGGMNMPMFEIELNINWEIVSASCNMTFAECLEYYNNGKTSGYLREFISDPQEPWEMETSLVMRSASSTEAVFTYFFGAAPGNDIVYHSNGTIEEISPSTANLELTATQNGYYSPSNGVYTWVQVSVPTGDNYQAKTGITPTTSSQTIQPDSGYDALSSVQINAMPNGTAGTPSAAKGAVSNHSVSITPSVTNTAGYVPSETKTGTPVTVSASELVSGSETKTANGTYDVTNLASLVVNVSGGGGGASNIVTGTFKGTTTGAAMDVTLDYSGSGYPVVFLVYVSGGPRNTTAASGTNAYTWYRLVQRYACGFIVGIKNETNTTPTYESSGTNNNAVVYQWRKNSTSAYDNFTGSMSTGGNAYSGSDAVANNTVGIVHFKTSKKMSVFIASNSYGFAANIEYTYHVIYSS